MGMLRRAMAPKWARRGERECGKSNLADREGLHKENRRRNARTAHTPGTTLWAGIPSS
jgi:hypothetical protein